MGRVELSGKLPACSRCRADLITSAVMPQDDDAGRPIHLELCRSCDADKPAAGPLLRWFATGGGHDPSRAQEGVRLMLEWTKEGMAEHGWYWAGPDEVLQPPHQVPGEAAERSSVIPEVPDGLPNIERLQQQRDALRAQLATAPAEEHEALRRAIRQLGGAIAEALIATDETAQALRAEAPRPAPGPLSPEATREILDLYERLKAEQAQHDRREAEGHD